MSSRHAASNVDFQRALGRAWAAIDRRAARSDRVLSTFWSAPALERSRIAPVLVLAPLALSNAAHPAR